MSNVVSKTQQEQVIALGRLGWTLRKIEEATGCRRETIGKYLRLADVAVRPPGRWGRAPPVSGEGSAKAAIEVSAARNASQTSLCEAHRANILTHGRSLERVRKRDAHVQFNSPTQSATVEVRTAHAGGVRPFVWATAPIGGVDLEGESESDFPPEED